MSDKQYASQSRWSRRRKLLIGGVVALIVLGLALGLGLGLTLGRDDGDDGDSGPAESISPLPTPSGTPKWKPRVGESWQIILQSPIKLDSDATSVTPDVDVYDIDLFDNPKETIDTLHRLGKKVICYFSGGSYEPNRPDSKDFDGTDMGKELDGWPGERWLKLSSDKVRKIMKERIELAAGKGCDAVDPDNVDGFQNDNGIGLTKDDSVSFMSYLSNLTVPLNLTLGLKNAGDIINTVLPIVDFSVNEQCVDEKECDTFHAFIAAGKPVFHIEYPKDAGKKDGLKEDVVQKYCGRKDDAAGSDDFSTVLKNMDLDGWVEYCDKQVKVTAVMQKSSGK